MADFFQTAFSRVWPQRIFTGVNKAPSFTSNQAQITAGTGAAGLSVYAGANVPGTSGKNLTLTIATGSGSLTVTSNGYDITVTLASGGSHAAAVVAAINAAFVPAFVEAALLPGSAGGSNVAALAQTNFTVPSRGQVALGVTNQAQLTVGTTTHGIIYTAGSDIPGAAGNNLSLTVASGSGSLTVASVGLDITITLASGGNVATDLITAVNAQFLPAFVSAAALTTGAGSVTTLSKTYFVASQRAP